MNKAEINALAAQVIRHARLTFFTCPETGELDSSATVINRTFSHSSGGEVDVGLAIGAPITEPPRWLVQVTYDGDGRKRKVTVNELYGSAADAVEAFNGRNEGQGLPPGPPLTLLDLQTAMRKLARRAS